MRRSEMPDCELVIEDTDESPYCYSFEQDDYPDEGDGGEEDDDE